MCAIAGFFSPKIDIPDNSKGLLEAMLRPMSYRGPDGKCFFVGHDHGLAMAHARLSIIDLDCRANQPFFSQDKSFCIVFNGEIYNYRDLRSDLEVLGYEFTTSSDTESLLNAFIEWGPECLDRLDGIFAFATYDFKKRSLFYARDRIGVKPAFFSYKKGIFSFASQCKSILTLPWIEQRTNNLALYHYLTFMSCPAPLTFTKGVFNLPAGHYLEIDGGGNFDIKQWYCPIKRVCRKYKDYQGIDLKQAVDKTEKLIEESVRKRLICDVPVASFLSGGLDSSLITAFSARLGKRLETFNISFKNDLKTDERLWARKVSLMFGSKHHEIEIERSCVEGLFSSMIDSCDQPLADCVNIPLKVLSEYCSKKGFKVVLIGEGADEIFFGYPDYFKYRNIDRAVPRFLIRTFGRFINKFFNNPSHFNIVENALKKRPFLWGNAIAFFEHEKRILKKSFKFDNHYDSIVERIFPGINQGFDSFNIVEYHLKKINENFGYCDFYRKTAFLEIKNRIPELLLARADQMSMAHGLEARVPFLDYNLVEFILSLPEKIRLPKNTTKPLLKIVAERVLPESVVYRKKVGFSAPLDWFGSNVKKWTLENLRKYRSVLSKAVDEKFESF